MARNIDIPQLQRIALGQVPNNDIHTKFGINPDVDAATAPEDIWNGGGTYTGFPVGGTATVAETLQVFSSSTADTAAVDGDAQGSP